MKVIRLPRMLPRIGLAALGVFALAGVSCLPSSEARSARAAAVKPTVTQTVTQTVTVTAPPQTVTVTEPAQTVTVTEAGATVTVTVIPTPTDPTTTVTTPPISSTTTTPTTTTTITTTPVSGWPDASNTGHSGTLTAYTSPCTIQTADLVIDSRDITCGQLLIQAPRVVVRNSKAIGIEVDYRYPSASVTIEDSTVNIGASSNSAVGGHDFTIIRSEILGGQHSVGTDGNATVVDSWLHGQYNPDGQGFHNNAFITNGGANMTVRHNTLHCTPQPNSTGGGCTADLSLFGDFSQVSNVLVENNLFKANGGIAYCAYGGHQPAKPYPNSVGIRFLGNVFERGSNNKCAAFGPVTSFDPNAAGNVWSGNVWEDGATVPSSD